MRSCHVILVLELDCLTPTLQDPHFRCVVGSFECSDLSHGISESVIDIKL